MSYIFWNLLFQWLILAINEVFLSILPGVRILLTHCNCIEHEIWHLVSNLKSKLIQASNSKAWLKVEQRDTSSFPTSSSRWNLVKNNWRLCTLDKRVADAYLLLQIINICSPHAAKQLLAPCCGNLQVNGLHCTMQVLTASTDGPLLFNLPVLKFSGHGHPLQIPTTIEATSPPGQLCVTGDLSTVLHSTLKTFPLTTVYYCPLEVATSPKPKSLGNGLPLSQSRPG